MQRRSARTTFRAPSIKLLAADIDSDRAHVLNEDAVYKFAHAQNRWRYCCFVRHKNANRFIYFKEYRRRNSAIRRGDGLTGNDMIKLDQKTAAPAGARDGGRIN